MIDDPAPNVPDVGIFGPLGPIIERHAPRLRSEMLAAFGLALAAVSVAVWSPTTIRIAGAAGVVAMAIAVVVGRDSSVTRRHVVTATGLTVLAASDAGLVEVAQLETMWRPLVALIAYPLLGRALLDTVGRLRLFRPTDVIVEAVLIGAAAAIAAQLGIQWWATSHSDAGQLTPAWTALPALLIGLDVSLTVVIGRSITATTVRRPTVVVAAFSTMTLMLGHLVAAAALASGTSPGIVVSGLVAIALAVMGLGALHAAISSPLGIAPLEVPLFSSGHAAIVVIAVLAPPAVICVQIAYGLSVSGSVAVGAALIGTVLATHVVNLLRERADSEHQATHDVLTGLPNRLLFMDRLERAIAHAERNNGSVGVLYIDLDRFKDVNDTLGHHGGDQLLRQTAQRLLSCARHEDSVARLSGDEFAMLLPHLSAPDDILLVADRALHAVMEPVTLADHTIHSSGSVGVAVYPDDGTTPADLLNAADGAMYRAKDQGGAGIALFSTERHEHATTRLELETALHHGIDSDELMLHYQPIVEGANGWTCGAEALVRWNHPERGMIPPGEFIPLAEQSELITKLGNWVIRAACFELARWRSLGYGDRFLSVNVSPRHFRDDLVSSVTSALRESGADPTKLVIELTESAAVDDVELVADRLRELRHIGVRAAIDDFGTGYCGLQYLGDLPVSTLKLDQSFVQAMTPRSAAIVAATIAMARSLGLTLVAEGVETADQKRFLERHGCDRMQGYHLGRPMPADEFVDRLRVEDGAARAALDGAPVNGQVPVNGQSPALANGHPPAPAIGHQRGGPLSKSHGARRHEPADDHAATDDYDAAGSRSAVEPLQR